MLKEVPDSELSEEYQNKIKNSLIMTGDARFLRVLANAPHIASWYFDSFYKEIFYNGKVPLRIKELVRLRLSKLHGCLYWNTVNSASARRINITDEEINELGKKEPLLAKLKKALSS